MPTDSNSAHKAFESADELQSYLLLGVSRTFALTIPQLPAGLCSVVSNGYLLCRIVDTIEDDPALDAAQKRDFAERFVAVVSGEAEAEPFARSLAKILSDVTIPAEHELIQYTTDVIKITHSFDAQQREALTTCVRVMAEGMASYQELDTRTGLATFADMEKYCYYVAGVVGEMLTQLFCAYSPEMDKHRETMQKLSLAFGQGLQMTNILKDIWDDYERGACWLPQDIFSKHGFDLATMQPGQVSPEFEKGMEELIAIAFDGLRQALEYTLLIPAHEAGIRSFCFLAIGMAELTLRKINDHKSYTQGDQVKISRRSVRAVIASSRVAVRSDLLLRGLFKISGKGLPRK